MSKLPVIPDPDKEEAQQGADELRKLIKAGFSGAWGEREEKVEADRGGMSKSRRKTLRRNKAARASRRRNRRKGGGKG